jgi:pyridinium-3,5-bisthiocarboxylic acid mononucleotide nickel chelatase
VGSAIGLTSLGVDRFSSRSVPPGSGTVKCEHGVMPVPAPATAILLQGVPLASVPVTGEMTTPTGAAILTTIVSEWTDQPQMTVERIGHGAGTKDFPDWPNVLRLLIGATTQSAQGDTIWVLETNLDDVSAELIGYCMEQAFAAGALDAWTVPIQMKKSRPGVLLSVIAPTEKVAELETILFRETATFGVRRFPAQRHKLEREGCIVPTPWGPVRGKKGWRDNLAVFTPEYEDCARVAREHGIPLREVFDSVRQSFARGATGGP